MTVDSMIATILRQEPKDRRSCIIAWRQLSDILAQRGNQLDEGSVRKALHALAVLRPDIPEHVRRDTAQAIARHGRFAPIVALYAHDVPSVSNIILRWARLSEADWLALLPGTSPVARSVLISRKDLSENIRRALASLGSGTAALPQPADVVVDQAVEAADDATSGAASSQISELVRRIDKYQSRRPQPVASAQRTTFLFETTAEGIIHWVDGISRAAVIGLSIAEATISGEPGTDGVAAGAFRQRAEMINAHMVIGGATAEAGEWRFSALPWFDAATGQFRGYRGSARRPHRNEIPYGLPHSENPGDSIRQLIHELRSPLNAISGFAQIISGQMFGPVNQTYRSMAEAIVADAAAVQTIIDDLETAARGAVADGVDLSTDVTDIGATIEQVQLDLAGLLSEQNVDLSVTRVGGPFAARIDASNARRMIGRLLTALVDVSEPDKVVVGQLLVESTDATILLLRMVRPAAIRFATATELLDPGYSPEGEAPGAAILSLGFSLRLVDSLARAAGGKLEIGHNALTLQLPSANSDSASDRTVEQGE